jgi:hypothetical protein
VIDFTHPVAMDTGNVAIQKIVNQPFTLRSWRARVTPLRSVVDRPARCATRCYGSLMAYQRATGVPSTA